MFANFVYVSQISLSMTLSIKQDNLTVAVELEEDGFEKTVTCEEVMLAAYDIIARIYSDKAVVKAYFRTDPDRMTERGDDDPVLKMSPY